MNRRGFTLLELSVAFAIFGVLALVAYGVFARVLSAKQIVEARAEEASIARTTIARMVRDIRAVAVRTGVRGPLQPTGGLPPTGGPAVPTPAAGGGTGPKAASAAPAFVSIDHTEGQAPLDEIAFTAVVRRPLSLAATASDLAAVHYFLRPQDGRPERFILYRESISSLSGEKIDLAQPNPAATSAIVGGVAALRFRFYDGEEWTEEWSSLAGRTVGRVPAAVEIQIALEGGDGAIEPYHTAVDLPAAQATGGASQIVAGAAGGAAGASELLGKGGGQGSGNGKVAGQGLGSRGKKPARDVDEEDDEDE